jgi:hypothetical protein
MKIIIDLVDGTTKTDAESIAQNIYKHYDLVDNAEVKENESQNIRSDISKDKEKNTQKLKDKISKIASEMESYIMNYPMAEFAKRLRELSVEEDK